MVDPPEKMVSDPRNSEVSERLARVEEQIDHQSEVLERIERRVDEDHDQLVKRVEHIEPRNQQLWTTYQAGKWFMAVGSGGGLLALAVSSLLL